MWRKVQIGRNLSHLELKASVSECGANDTIDQPGVEERSRTALRTSLAPRADMMMVNRSGVARRLNWLISVLCSI